MVKIYSNAWQYVTRVYDTKVFAQLWQIPTIGSWKSHLEPPIIIGIKDININHNKSAGEVQKYYCLPRNNNKNGLDEQGLI